MVGANGGTLEGREREREVNPSQSCECTGECRQRIQDTDSTDMRSLRRQVCLCKFFDYSPTPSEEKVVITHTELAHIILFSHSSPSRESDSLSGRCSSSPTAVSRASSSSSSNSSRSNRSGKHVSRNVRSLQVTGMGKSDFHMQSSPCSLIRRRTAAATTEVAVTHEITI